MTLLFNPLKWGKGLILIKAILIVVSCRNFKFLDPTIWAVHWYYTYTLSPLILPLMGLNSEKSFLSSRLHCAKCQVSNQAVWFMSWYISQSLLLYRCIDINIYNIKLLLISVYGFYRYSTIKGLKKKVV